ncbi:MAG: YabP/YqfC family sporulation protein [Bacilli bacterium]|jgi:sporulation protein YqfC|nr:YabP/YqfC family sporulation protein [Bacilli bacterium]
MNIITRLTDYIDDKGLKIIIEIGRIYICNYIEIMRVDEKTIKLKYANGYININGHNLLITKLVDQEILITGQLKTIEMGSESE